MTKERFFSRLTITPPADRVTSEVVAGPGDKDHEHPGADGMIPEVGRSDQVLALAGLAVDDRDAVGLRPRSESPREVAGHEMRVAEVSVAATVQPSPPHPEPARRVAEREVGVGHDTVDAVVVAVEQVLIPIAETHR